MKAAGDTVLVLQEQLRTALRNPLWVLIGAVQPILSLALFGPLLQRLVGGPGLGTGNAWQVLVPGLLVQLSLFSTAFVGLAVIGELKAGILERVQVTAVSRFALLAGRVLQSVVLLLGQCLLLVLAAVAFGLRVSPAGVALSIALILVTAGATTALSYAVALRIRDDFLLAPLLNLVVVPLPLLSGVLLPLTLAPTWLKAASRLIPFSYLVDASRQAFLGYYHAPEIRLAAVVSACYAAVALIAGTHAFRRTGG